MSDAADDSDGNEGRRKRIRQACLNCRRKKVRCGGEKPVCNFCHRLSQACIYSEDGRSRNRSPVASQNTQGDSSSSLMDTFSSKFSALEERLSRIEGMLDRLIPMLSSITSSQPGPEPQASPSSAQSSIDHQLQPPRHQRDANDSAVALRPSLPPPSPEATLPPIHTLLFAADIYFRFYYNQPYSLFHEPSFRHRLVSGELPLHLVWALLASARRYSTLPDLQLNANDDSMHYAEKAWECLDLPWDGSVEEGEVVPVIQSLILVVNVEHAAGKCSSAYMKLGFAIRLALYSNMHMEPEETLSPTLREERRRTFWCLYLQDKLISLSRERFCILQDESCRVRLPCSEEAWQKGREEVAPTLEAFRNDYLDQEAVDSCSPLALITVVASVLGRVSRYILQEKCSSLVSPPWSSASPYAAISSALLQLELHFGVNEPAMESVEQKCYVGGAVDQHLAGSFLYAKAVFHLCHCLLHHPFLLQQRLHQLKQKAPPSFLRTVWDTCRTHAKSLTELKDMRNHNVTVLTSLYGYCTMVAGTIHILSMSDENPETRQAGLTHYKSALQFLQELSCYWKQAGLMASRLERFYKQREERRPILNSGVENTGTGQSPADLKALWQSVDYTELSTPTRPGSPVNGVTPTVPEFFDSPSRLFDFSDFNVMVDMAYAFPRFPLVPGAGPSLLPGDVPPP